MIFKMFAAAAIVVLVTAGTICGADDKAVIRSVGVRVEHPLSADPDIPFWKRVPPALANRDKMGQPVTKEIMEIRSRWTKQNLYILFVCAFTSMYLKPNPSTTAETNELWKWDVAEAFIGDDFENINRYKEFEVSPQGEWVDLDIDRSVSGGSPTAWLWNSGFQVKARIDETKKLWYAEMRIPFASISRKPAAAGLQLRINFFRTQGEAPNRLLLTWQPTYAPSFHVPSAFGILSLAPVEETK